MAISMGDGKQSTLLNEINITPFVDVVLVLLVIFMVTAPMINRGVEVNLPRTRAAVMEVDDAKLLLVINERREVYLDDQKVPPDRLEIVIRTNERLQTDREVYLQADRNVPYGFVAHIMSILREAGVDQVGLVTDPVETEGEVEMSGGEAASSGDEAPSGQAAESEGSDTTPHEEEGTP